MANIGFDVYLRGNAKGGIHHATQRAKSKLSASQTSQVSKIASKQSTQKSALATFMSTGSMLKSAAMALPVVRELAVMAKLADKGGQFLIGLYQAHTNEDMLASNAKATLKAYTTLGQSVISASINNMLYTRPRVRLQNNALEYGRNLYLRNVENEKNSFS